MNKKATTGIGSIIAFILIVLFMLLGGDPDDLVGDTTDRTGTDGGTVVGSDPSGDSYWYEIYFTNPICSDTDILAGGIDEDIALDIRNARSTVDIAAYEFDSEPIAEALIAVEEEGVTVRLVSDSDYEDEVAVQRLQRAGIPVVFDERSALMHNKFIVIDNQVVWMGSMNFTSNGVYCNNNNSVRFDAPALAENYTTEMNEMFDDHEFGPRSPENTPREELVINGVSVENYFAPEKELAPLIAGMVANTSDEILFMAFQFTHDEIGQAMLERARDGVEIRGVFEKTGSGTEYSYFTPLNEFGRDVAVKVDGNNRIMHHKVIILDRETVIFGSFNFSANANDSNDENIVVVHDPEFAGFFVEEFELVWAAGEER